MKKTLKFLGYLVVLTLIVNFVLAIFSTIFPIQFLKPEGLIDPPKVFFHIIIGSFVIAVNQTVVNTWVIMLLLFGLLYFGTRKISVDNPGTLQLILEELYRFVEEYFVANFMEYKRSFAPFFAAMFSLILLSNLSVFFFPFVFMITKQEGTRSIVPFFRTATADINTTVGFALIVFALFIICWIKRKGPIGMIKDLCEPAFVMLPINLLGELAKPINISMRLFGNMFAGLIMMSLLYGISINGILGTWTDHILKGSMSFAVAWPAGLQLYLDLFVGIIQAFIFTVLSSVYVEQALIGYDDDEN